MLTFLAMESFNQMKTFEELQYLKYEFLNLLSTNFVPVFF